eukprot:scaffold20352_cov28-Tisochrysis_lutea.AAC.4
MRSAAVTVAASISPDGLREAAARLSAKEAADRMRPASSAPLKCSVAPARDLGRGLPLTRCSSAPSSTSSGWASISAAASGARAPLARMARVWMRRMSRRPAASGSSTLSCTSSLRGQLVKGDG